MFARPAFTRPESRSKYSDWQCQICGYSLPPLTYDPGCAARAHMRSHGQPGLDILQNYTAANDLEFKARLERNAASFLEKRLAARRDSFKAKLKGLNALLPAWSCEFVLAHGVDQKGVSMVACSRCSVAVSSSRRMSALRTASMCTALSEPERSQAIAIPVRQRQVVVACAVLEAEQRDFDRRCQRRRDGATVRARARRFRFL